MALPILLGGLLARFGGRTVARRAAVSVGLGGAGSIVARRLGLTGGGGDDAPRRRRRRRALTQGDRADIAFVAATLGKAAADRFASQLVAGNRG